MAYDLKNKLVVAVSARALFRQAETGNKRNKVQEGLLQPGAAFGFIKRLLCLNDIPEQEKCVEVILLSHGDADMSVAIFRTLAHYKLGMTRAFFLGGADIAPYLAALHVDLLLSVHPRDVQTALGMGIAAGMIDEAMPEAGYSRQEEGPLRIAFDGDAVLFSDAAEQIFQRQGLTAFEENEVRHAGTPLEEGPFASFLRKLLVLQRALESERGGEKYIRTALVTSRCAPTHERVIRTLRAWDMELDEVYFLGGIAKKEILQAFGADIFFDDQQVHTEPASEAVLAALVVYGEYTGRTQIQRQADVQLINIMDLEDADRKAKFIIEETKTEETKTEETGSKIKTESKIKTAGRSYEIRQYSGRDFPGETKQIYRLCGDQRKARDGPCQKYRQVQRAP